MKIKTANLEWYVMNYDFNSGTLKKYNVLTGIAEDLSKEVKRGKVNSLSTLKEYLRRVFMYHYWSRTEYEILVSDLSSRNVEKVDIWYQLEMNLDRIVEYVNRACDLKF